MKDVLVKIYVLEFLWDGLGIEILSFMLLVINGNEVLGIDDII